MVTIEYAYCTLIHVLHIVSYELGHNMRYLPIHSIKAVVQNWATQEGCLFTTGSVAKGYLFSDFSLS